jgi:hypothetical protein
MAGHITGGMSWATARNWWQIFIGTSDIKIAVAFGFEFQIME